jgi:peptidoglycan/LPS O-acetylase OafA/YrhL
MRGIAALGVMAYHSLLPPRWYFEGFNTFVDFFFVLSGFVLAPTLLNVSAGSTKKFIVVRLLRLFPMLIPIFITLLLMKQVSFFARNLHILSQTPLVNYLGAFLLLQIFWASTIHLNTPLWSLSGEWFINLFSIKFRPRHKNYIMVLAGLFIEIIGLFLNHKYHLGWGVVSYLIAIGRVMVGFYLGIILRIHLSNQSRQGSIRIFLISLLMFLSNFLLFGYSDLFVLFASPICWLIVREVASFNQSQISGSLRSFFIYIGRISYGVYAWHSVTGWIALPAFILKYSQLTLTKFQENLFTVTASILIVVVATEISIRLFETPIKRIAYKHLQILKG